MMTERKVTDSDNTEWTCVQAMGGLSEGAKDEAAARVETKDGLIPVVCTPSGGAQSVRVELPRDWEDNASDDELLRAINRAR